MGGGGLCHRRLGTLCLLHCIFVLLLISSEAFQPCFSFRFFCVLDFSAGGSICHDVPPNAGGRSLSPPTIPSGLSRFISGGSVRAHTSVLVSVLMFCHKSISPSPIPKLITQNISDLTRAHLAVSTFTSRNCLITARRRTITRLVSIINQLRYEFFYSPVWKCYTSFLEVSCVSAPPGNTGRQLVSGSYPSSRPSDHHQRTVPISDWHYERLISCSLTGSLVNFRLTGPCVASSPGDASFLCSDDSLWWLHIRTTAEVLILNGKILVERMKFSNGPDLFNLN